jgi:hypothetical protein
MGKNGWVICSVLSAVSVLPARAQISREPLVNLPGHVLGILSQATLVPRPVQTEQETLTVSVMLKLTDPESFAAFERELNDPNSASYHRTINGSDFTTRFGPSQDAYAGVLAYFEQNGFTLVKGSTNRITLTFRATRAQAESAFHVSIDDYLLGDRKFYAIASDPWLPASITSLVAGVSGLSNLARWTPFAAPSPATSESILTAYGGKVTPSGSTNSAGLPPGIDGTGQTIAILSFFSYNRNDVINWLSHEKLPASLINNLSDYTVGAGITNTLSSREPLVDIDTVLAIAPGAKVVVYLAPEYDGGAEASDDYTPIAAAIDNMWLTGGVISTSYGLCEAEIAFADAGKMDSLLESASTVGITLFAATGDTGTTCQGRDDKTYPNTIPYPASSPHAIAVGGTSLSVNAGNAYGSESYWNNSIGSGGHGFSLFWAEPNYQTSAFGGGATGRSVPDVSMDADPGITVCMQTPSADPGCLSYGGTSMAAPLWAGVWALANQANQDALGYTFSPSSGYFYTLSANAFHAPSTIGSGTYWKVGLGTPDIPALVAHAIPPSITNFSPDSGPASGGTLVTITGTGFIGVEKVTFGGVTGTNLKIESASKLTVETPAHVGGNAMLIELVTPGGAAKLGSFTFVPSITGFNPAVGPTVGGETVVVYGTGLSAGMTLKFGDAAATISWCGPLTDCEVISPAHAVGSVQLTATVGGAVSLASKDQFSFDLFPTITGISPNTIPQNKGFTATKVVLTITGTGFSTTPGQTVFNYASSVLSDVACGAATTSGATACTAVFINPPSDTPKVTNVTTGVTVTVNGLTSLDSVNFTYPTPPPVTPPCKGTTCS